VKSLKIDIWYNSFVISILIALFIYIHLLTHVPFTYHPDMITIIWITRITIDALDTVFHVGSYYTEHCYFMYSYHYYTNTPIHWTLFEYVVVMIMDTVITCTCIIIIRTLLFSVHVTSLHEYCIILDIVISCTNIIITRIFYYTGHCYFMYLYHRDTDTLLYWTLLFHILVSPWHRYTITYDIIIHVLVSSLYRYAVTLDTVISYSCITDTQTHPSIWHDCFLYHWFDMTFIVTWITVLVTLITVTWVFLYSRYLDIS